MDSLALIREFLKDRIGVEPEKVVPEAALAELGVDSLLLLELMFEFEDRFDIKLSQDLQPPKTVGEMVTTMGTLIGEQKAEQKA
jgi:acyl carrier protein